MNHDPIAAGVVAAELTEAVELLCAHTRVHCDHAAGLLPGSCATCDARVQAIGALDRTADACRLMDEAIEAMLTALDTMRTIAADPCAACEDAAEVADRAERRYRVWIDDAPLVEAWP